MKSFYSKNFRLGILGGGQLGRMFIQEAMNYDVRISVLDPAADAPCSAYAHEFVQGSFNDFETVHKFGKNMDVLTIEIEHVNIEALEALHSEGVKIFPTPASLRIVQDKGLQKEFYEKNGIATAPFVLVNNKEEILNHQQNFPLMQKMRKGGYDGKGVQALRHEGDLQAAFNVPSVLEQMIDFEKEISLIIARNEAEEIATFPLVEMEFNAEANLVEFLHSPANVSVQVEEQAMQLAKLIVEKLNFVGLLAVEMFVDKDGKVWVNEIAPRPHNSGHHTIEACITSQYEQHLRSILNLPLGATALVNPAVMINLLGEKNHTGPVHYHGLDEAMNMPGVHIHLYGKSDTKPFRKMGHVTCTAATLEAAITTARKVASMIKVVSQA